MKILVDYIGNGLYDLQRYIREAGAVDDYYEYTGTILMNEFNFDRVRHTDLSKLKGSLVPVILAPITLEKFEGSPMVTGEPFAALYMGMQVRIVTWLDNEEVACFARPNNSKNTLVDDWLLCDDKYRAMLLVVE